MIDRLRTYSSAIGAFVLLAVPLVLFGLDGTIPWYLAAVGVLVTAVASFNGSVGVLALPVIVVMFAAVRAVESSMILVVFGLAIVGAIWLLDLSRDARRSAHIDVRVSSARRRSAAVVVSAALVLVGASSIAARFGNDAGLYLPIGLFVSAALVAAMARWIGRASTTSVSDQFAPGRRA